MDRRDFIRISGIAGGGLMIAIPLPMCAMKSEVNTYPLNLFVKITSDNHVIIGSHRQEIGQGVVTSLPMMLAEEMCADWSKVKVEYLNFGDEAKRFLKQCEMEEFMSSGGSLGMPANWMMLRNAGAAIRAVLEKTAAEKWGIPVDECFAYHGFVQNTRNNKKLSFGELAEKAAAMELPEEVQLKTHNDFTIIGRPTLHAKGTAIVTGAHKYSLDYEGNDLVYAAITINPVIGTKVQSFNKEKVLALPGVVDVFEIPSYPKTGFFNGIDGGVAVVANSTWEAFQGKKVLEEDVQWESSPYMKKDDQTLQEEFSNTFLQMLNINYEKGNPDSEFDQATRKLEVRYSSPYLGHALMEPLNATAFYKENEIEVWSGTQSPEYTSNYLSEVFGIPIDNIKINCFPSGGGFGRRFFTDFIGQAILISKHLNKKVKLVWTREDEIRNGRYHPFRQDQYQASLNENGNISSLLYKGITTHEWGAGAYPLYHIPNIREESKIVDTIIPFGSWRSVVFHNRILGVESFIDEMAHLANQDPIEFRIRHLQMSLEKVRGIETDDEEILTKQQVIPRHIEVLQVAREKSGWGKRMPNNEGMGVAIADLGGGAKCDYNKAVCAHVVHAAVGNGKWRIKKIYSIVYCGTIINPLGVRAQIEGSINWSLTPLIYGGVTVKNGRVVERNFNDYKVLRYKGAPEVEIHLIKSEDKPNGMGEPAVPPLAPAVLNALYAASGKRFRDIHVKELEYEFA